MEEMPNGVDVSERCSKVRERWTQGGQGPRKEGAWGGPELERWISDPKMDRDLARRVLGEVQSKVEVFIGINVTLEMEDMLWKGKLELEKGKE